MAKIEVIMKTIKKILTLTFFSFLITLYAPSINAFYFEKAQIKAWFAQRPTTIKAAAIVAGVLGIGVFTGIFFAVSNAIRALIKINKEQKKELSLPEKRSALLAAVKGGFLREVERHVDGDPRLITCTCTNKDYVSEGNQQLDVAEIALRRGLHTCGVYDEDGFHPIHHAAKLGYKNIVDYFLSKGVDSTTRSAENKTAADYLREYNDAAAALARAREETARLLLTEQVEKEREAALAREAQRPVFFHMKGKSLPKVKEES